MGLFFTWPPKQHEKKTPYGSSQVHALGVACLCLLGRDGA